MNRGNDLTYSLWGKKNNHKTKTTVWDNAQACRRWRASSINCKKVNYMGQRKSQLKNKGEN